jgi:hypothetical protein
MTDEDKKLIAGYMGWKYEADRNCIISEGINHSFICDEWKFDWRTTVARKKGIDQFKGEKE